MISYQVDLQSSGSMSQIQLLQMNTQTNNDLQNTYNQLNQNMIRLMSKGFKMSLYRQEQFYEEVSWLMIPHLLIPQLTIYQRMDFQRDVSDLLQIPYLSKYKGNKEELSHKFKYEGVIIGDHSRIFFSIPTAQVNSQEYYYVHYLLDTGSPYTTLTHQTLCCLFNKKDDDQNVLFPSLLRITIGSVTVHTHLSNPNPTEKNRTFLYHNVNRLGMNFLREYKRFQLIGDFKKKCVFLQLIE